MNKNGYCLLSLIVACWALLGCYQRPNTDQYATDDIEEEKEEFYREGIYALPGDYELEHHTDLTAYFDSLCHEGLFVATHNNDKKDSLMVWDAIRLLDRYIQGKDSSYPETEVRKALEILRTEQAYCFNHGEQEGRNGGEAFMFRFIEQAAANCNHIQYITDFQSDDSKAGVLYFEEWGLGNPLYSILVYQKNQGFGVRMIGDVGSAKIEEIHHLTDKQGRNYYLCSNNNDGVYFCQYLYGWKNEDLRLICQLNVEFGCPDCNEKGYELVFNPEQCIWSYCKKEGGLYHRVDNTPMLQLILNGDSSKFVVESASQPQ